MTLDVQSQHSVPPVYQNYPWYLVYFIFFQKIILNKMCTYCYMDKMMAYYISIKYQAHIVFYYRSEPYAQSTLVPVPPNLFDHQNAYSSMLLEPPFPFGYWFFNLQFSLSYYHIGKLTLSNQPIESE